MSEGGARPVSLIKSRPGARAIIKGQDAGRFLDFYHGILTASWPGFVLRLAALFLVVNLVFAMLYVTDQDGVSNARPGNFTDDFFFSVQTISGYGVMEPKTLYTNLLVTAESFVGILIIALFAGIIFARFSRPFARVVFSKNAVVTTFDGLPMLMFRAANQRGNSILDATATVSLASNYTTREGDRIRRFQELKLVRSANPLFALSWTVMHPIDETSPLYNLGLAEMIERDMQIVVMLGGMDETIADRIYARYSYLPEEILWRHRFVDVISVTPGGQRLVDLVHFHDTEEIIIEAAEPDGGIV